MSHNLIVVGGCAPDSFDANMKYDRVICADSGYDTAKRFNLKVDIVVGDFDSTLFTDELLSFGYDAANRDKDESDTELALKLLNKGDTYDLIGGGEGRCDHFIAILSLLYRYPAPKVWYTNCETLYFVNGKFEIETRIGTVISIIPVEYDKKVFVNSDGLFWSLEDFEISASKISLSNRADKDKVKLISTGPVFCVINKL